MGANVHSLINIHRPAKIMILHSFLFNRKMTVLTCDYCVEDRKDIKKVCGPSKARRYACVSSELPDFSQFHNPRRWRSDDNDTHACP